MDKAVISSNIGQDTYLYKLKARTDINLTDLDSARPYSIGVGRANLFRQFFERHGFEHLVPNNRRSQSLKMLLAGRIDLLSHYSFNIVTTCEQANTTTDLLSPALQLKGLTSGVYLVASPNSDPEFRQKLKEAYRAKADDGTLRAMIDTMEAAVVRFPAWFKCRIGLPQRRQDRKGNIWIFLRVFARDRVSPGTTRRLCPF